MEPSKPEAMAESRGPQVGSIGVESGTNHDTILMQIGPVRKFQQIEVIYEDWAEYGTKKFLFSTIKYENFLQNNFIFIFFYTWTLL